MLGGILHALAGRLFLLLLAYMHNHVCTHQRLSIAA